MPRKSFLSRLALTTALLAPVAATLPAQSAHAAKAKADALEVEMDVKSFTLDNGLRVYVIEDHSTPAFNINITYDVGSRDEVAGRTGFAHFFEHMMFEGSENVPDGGVFKYTEQAGGNLNAYTSFDTTVYFHNLPSQYLDMVMWVEADRMANLAVTQVGFETQRSAVKSEKDRSDNDPMTQLFTELLGGLFKGSPYDHMPIGTLDDLNAAEAKDAQAFFNTFYRPNNAAMVLVGDVDFEEVKAKAQKYFGGIARGADKPAPPAFELAPLKKTEREFKDSRTQQPMYIWAWRTVGQDHPDRAALDLLGSALFNGASARLPKILVDEKQWAAGMGGGHELVLRKVGGMMLMAMPTAGAKADDFKKVVADELAKVAKKGLSKKELEKAINKQLMATVQGLASNAGRATAVADGAIGFNDPKRILTDLEGYRSVTNADIKRVAKQYLTEDWFFFQMLPE